MRTMKRILGIAAVAAVAAVAAIVGTILPATRSSAWADDAACTGEKYDCQRTVTCVNWNSLGNCTQTYTQYAYMDAKPPEM